MVGNQTQVDKTAEIIDRLDVQSEYEALGVRVAGKPAADGWLPVHAIGRDDRNASAAIHLRTGRYKDHGGEGENLSLWDAAVKAGRFPDWMQARAHYADKAGVAIGNGSHRGNGTAGQAKPATATATRQTDGQRRNKIFGTSAEALAVYVKTLGDPSTWYEYLDASGVCVGIVYRWDTPNGKKIRPVSRSGDGWSCCGLSEPRPLYRLPELAQGKRIVVAEGEKAADAIRDLGARATTSPHGARSADKADWVPLAGKEVIILPDNDDEGESYAADVVGLLAKLDPPPAVKIVRLPDLPPKGDAFDYIQRRRSEGAGRDEIKAEIKALADAAEVVNLSAESSQESEPTEPPAFTRLIDCRELLALDLRPRFLVRGVLVAGQPAVIGGRSKTLKTSVATDLVVSLGSGSKFLGAFDTERVNVAFWSGESGAATIRETARRVADARGVDLETCSILWSFDLPKLARQDHLQALAETIKERSITVAVIDPLYLSLLSPETASQAGNLFTMGAALQPLGEIGQQTGCTMIVLHHLRKSGQPDLDEPAALEELAQSGTAEWCRQWLLLARRSSYQADGHHELWLRAGGSFGHAGLWAIDVDEGLLDPDTLDGRRWEVAVKQAGDVRNEERQERENQKAERAGAKEADHRRRVLVAIQDYPTGETERTIRIDAGLNPENFARAVRQLVKEMRIEEITFEKRGRKYPGYRLKKRATEQTEQTEQNGDVPVVPVDT